MGITTPVKEMKSVAFSDPWMYQKKASMFSLSRKDNISWDTVVVCMRVTEESIRKSTGRDFYPLEFCGCTN